MLPSINDSQKNDDSAQSVALQSPDVLSLIYSFINPLGLHKLKAVSKSWQSSIELYINTIETNEQQRQVVAILYKANHSATPKNPAIFKFIPRKFKTIFNAMRLPIDDDYNNLISRKVWLALANDYPSIGLLVYLNDLLPTGGQLQRLNEKFKNKNEIKATTPEIEEQKNKLNKYLENIGNSHEAIKDSITRVLNDFYVNDESVSNKSLYTILIAKIGPHVNAILKNKQTIIRDLKKLTKQNYATICRRHEFVSTNENEVFQDQILKHNNGVTLWLLLDTAIRYFYYKDIELKTSTVSYFIQHLDSAHETSRFDDEKPEKTTPSALTAVELNDAKQSIAALLVTLEPAWKQPQNNTSEEKKESDTDDIAVNINGLTTLN